MNKEIPDILRPFFPYLVEEDLPNQIILKNSNTSYQKHLFLSLVLLMLVSATAFADLLTIIFLIFIFLATLLAYLQAGPRKIMISPSGITLTYKPFFIPLNKFLKKEEIQSIKYSMMSESIDRSSGCILVHRSRGRILKLLPLIRSKRDQIREDLNIIAARISYILAISTEAKVPESQLLPKPKYFGTSAEIEAINRSTQFSLNKRTQRILKYVLRSLSIIMLSVQIVLFVKYIDIDKNIKIEMDKDRLRINNDTTMTLVQKQKKIETIDRAKKSTDLIFIMSVVMMLIPFAIIIYTYKSKYLNPPSDQ